MFFVWHIGPVTTNLPGHFPLIFIGLSLCPVLRYRIWTRQKQHKQLNTSFVWTGTTLMEDNLSSSEIRARVKIHHTEAMKTTAFSTDAEIIHQNIHDNRSHLVEGLLPHSVLNYIRRYRLYQWFWWAVHNCDWVDLILRPSVRGLTSRTYWLVTICPSLQQGVEVHGEFSRAAINVGSLQCAPRDDTTHFSSGRV